MTTKQFDEIQLSKIAFQLGYTEVYRNEFGPKPEMATPDKWIVDSCVVNGFSSDYGFARRETDEGDFFSFDTKEEWDEFHMKFNVQIEKSEKLTVNDLLEEYVQLH